MCCPVVVPTSGRSLVQRSPTECGVSDVCDPENVMTRNGVEAAQKNANKLEHSQRIFAPVCFVVFHHIPYNYIYALVYSFSWSAFRRGAYKSLARPGRKQATSTKLGIYSAYSQRSSTHSLARCSNLCKPIKKSEICPSN